MQMVYVLQYEVAFRTVYLTPLDIGNCICYVTYVQNIMGEICNVRETVSPNFLLLALRCKLFESLEQKKNKTEILVSNIPNCCFSICLIFFIEMS